MLRIGSKNKTRILFVIVRCAVPAFYDALSSNKNSRYGGVYQCKRFILIYGNSELACKRQKAAQVPNPRAYSSSRQKHTQGKTLEIYLNCAPRVVVSPFYCREIIKAVKFQFPSGAVFEIFPNC